MDVGGSRCAGCRDRKATSEGLKREKSLYLANAGPYTAPDRDVLLAERIEALMTQENAKWVSSQEAAGKADAKPPETSAKPPEAAVKPPEAAVKPPEDSTKPPEDPTK
jgi:hypothetical protein